MSKQLSHVGKDQSTALIFSALILTVWQRWNYGNFFICTSYTVMYVKLAAALVKL